MSTPLSVNDSTAMIAIEALSAANACSKSMDLVPRPAYGALNLKWTIDELVDIGERIASGKSFKLSYSGINVSIPAGQKAIGSAGGEGNFLVFKFSEKAGKKYLAFTDITKDNSIKYGCDTNIFFSVLYKESANNTCNVEELAAYEHVFLKDTDHGIWVTGSIKAYYMVGKTQSFVFLFSKNKIIKIDSDFLSKDQLKNIIF